MLLAIWFEEPGWEEHERELEASDQLYASHLLEAEFRAAAAREGLDPEKGPHLTWFTWVVPARPLTLELRQILEMGYLRGADLWHLACCLHLGTRLPGLKFRTMDRRQAELARRLGFA